MIPDAGAGGDSNDQLVVVAVGNVPRSRDEALWGAEVARVRGAAGSLEPPIRAAVRSVLSSLAADPGLSPDIRAEARALLGSLEARRTSSGGLAAA